jgi:hypothetical protein
MTISVNLHLLPSFNNGQKTATVSLADGATAGDLLHALRIPRGDIGVIASGGAHLLPGDTLQGGMTVDLYPIVAGG